MTDFNPAGRQAFLFRNLLELFGVMHFVGRRIERRPLIHQFLQVAVKINSTRSRHVHEVSVTEDFAFTGFSQNNKFVAEVTANRTRIRAHRYRFEAHSVKGVQIGNEHFIVGFARVFVAQIKRIRIFHQKLATAHHAKTRTALVPEFPLNMIKDLGQFFVRTRKGSENIRDHVFIGWTVEHFALVTVDNAQHFRTIGIITPGFFPKIGRLNGRHEHFNRPCPVLLFTDNLLDFLENFVTERQPAINTGAVLLHHTGAQHILMRCDGRIRRGLFGQR